MMWNKLRTTSDHFEHGLNQVDYILSRTEGKPAYLLLPCAGPEAVVRLSTAEEDFEYPKAHYIDPNKRQRDRKQFRRLSTRTSLDWH